MTEELKNLLSEDEDTEDTEITTKIEQLPMNPKTEKPVDKPKKRGIFSKIGRGIKTGFKAVKDNPLAAGIGIGIGTILTGGAFIIGGMLSNRDAEDDVIDDSEDTIETEFIDDVIDDDVPVAEEVE